MINFVSRFEFFLVVIFFAASPGYAQRTFDTDILAETFGFDESTKKSVALDQLNQGCAERDCIPSIDDPKFVAASEASHVAPDDIVLALTWQGEHRAYPSKILDHHEIVNDVIAGTPIAITYCPLCGSAVGVLREINGQVTEFGVSGVLYNSDLVFYDRATETLWDQIIAEGIVGPLTGEKLTLVPITMTRWSKWKAAHPDTLVLSSELGTGRDYTQDRFSKYRQGDDFMFPVSLTNDAIRPKEVVYGFDFGEESVAITAALLQENPEYEYEMGGREVIVTLADDGTVRMHDTGSGESFAPIRLFWFAWYTFHPETELLR